MKNANKGVLAFKKTPTTSPNVTDGIETAVRSVIEESKVTVDQIQCLTIGTTHFINAIVEHDARRLSKVAILRLSKSFTKQIPPFSDFPEELKIIMNGYYSWLDGGLHIDGSQEASIVEEQVVRECQEIKKRGIDSVVISGVFAPIDESFHQEDHVRRIVLRELPGVDVVCSHEVSNIGFLERENASILNASVSPISSWSPDGWYTFMMGLYLDVQSHHILAKRISLSSDTLIRFPSI